MIQQPTVKFYKRAEIFNRGPKSEIRPTGRDSSGTAKNEPKSEKSKSKKNK